MTMVMPMAIIAVIAAELMMLMTFLNEQNFGCRMLKNINTITATISRRYLLVFLSEKRFAVAF
jgi:hypothetical protein